jgi:hypothetical protein
MVKKNKEQITIKSIKDIDIEIESYFKKNNKIPLTVLWIRKRKIDTNIHQLGIFLYVMNKKWSDLWWQSKRG